MRRIEVGDDSGVDDPPPLPNEVDLNDVLFPDQGAGPLYHRVYRVFITGSQISGLDLMARIRREPNIVSPTEFARFDKVTGDPDDMSPGDEYVVRMPGPWNGPVRAVAVTPSSFRFVTLKGHLEAGQIEFRAAQDSKLTFQIESWARSGDLLSHLMYDRLRMAKEIQLHMWTSTLERAVRLTRGARSGPIRIETRRIVVDG
jgi:Domain of unknown function (DUF1990)